MPERSVFDYRSFDTRCWSNDRLREIGAAVRGCESMLNVSGRLDSDQDGGRYRDYFASIPLHRVSNHPDDSANRVNHFTDRSIDLDRENAKRAVENYDDLRDQTEAERAYRPPTALETIAPITRRAPITLAPINPPMHFISDDFGDYYRCPPMALRAPVDHARLRVANEAASNDVATVHRPHLDTRENSVIDPSAHSPLAHPITAAAPCDPTICCA